MTIKQSISIKTTAAKAYQAIMSADQFSRLTAAPAEIASEEGGAFSCFGGQIIGRHIELVPEQRIIQAWRVKNMWDDGVYSVVRIDFDESGDTTTINLTHTGYPDDAAEHLEPGWHKMYWEPLKAYFE